MNFVPNGLLKVVPAPTQSLQWARNLNPDPQLLNGTHDVTHLHSLKHRVIDMGEQHMYIFHILLVEAIKFTAECPAPLHHIDKEAGVFIEGDTLLNQLGADESKHI